MILSTHGIVNSGSSNPLNINLYAVYKAESNANDSLGVYNGTAQGGLTYSAGKSGNAYTLNRSNSYVQLGDVMDLGTSSWSYSIWFNPTEVFFSCMLFGKTIASTVNGNFYSIIDQSKLKIVFDANASNLIIVETPATSILASNWYHAVIQIDRTDKVKLYLNGSAVTLTTTNGTNNLAPYSATNYNTNNPFRIGAGTGLDNIAATNFYGGKIDEFGVWNRVLTPTEITELYNAGNGKFYPY